MKYFEKAPSIAVSRFIKCYWVLEDDSPTNFVQTIVPDGRFELILNLRRPFQSLQSEQWYSQPDCFFVGQITGPLLVRAKIRSSTPLATSSTLLSCLLMRL